MEKPLSKSAACAAKTLFCIMQYMKENGGEIATKSINDVVLRNVEFTEWEKERSGKFHNYRWSNTYQFYSINYAKAGFIIKKNGKWFLTTEGEEALASGAESIFQKANVAYAQWKNVKYTNENIVDDNITDNNTDEEKEIIANLEQLESQANEGIKDYLNRKNPYEFQDMVAALLRSMGYYTPFIAPRGKDGGVDVTAHLDALGAKTPRIKVQVKHMPTTPIPVKDIRGLIGILRDGDMGLFVTSGSFSPSAIQEAQHSTTYVKLIDGDEFIRLWIEHYIKMTDEDKNMMPLKHIAFIGINE